MKRFATPSRLPSFPASLARLLGLVAISLIVLFATACDSGGSGMERNEVKRSVTYALDPVSNDGALPNGVSATATFQELTANQTLVTLTLDNGPTDMQVGHPAHIHLNSASEGGPIEIYLAPIDGLSHPNNDGTSSKVIDRGFDELTSLNGHINIHQSDANLGTVIAHGDIGANAGGPIEDGLRLISNPSRKSYSLSPQSNDGALPNGVSATATFTELTTSKTLVTLKLNGGPTDQAMAHPAHIHLHPTSEGGPIEIYLAPIDGLAHPNNNAESSKIIDRSFDELTSFDGHINIHESNANLGAVIANGNVGANADDNTTGDDNDDDDGGYGY